MYDHSGANENASNRMTETLAGSEHICEQVQTETPFNTETAVRCALHGPEMRLRNTEPSDIDPFDADERKGIAALTRQQDCPKLYGTPNRR